MIPLATELKLKIDQRRFIINAANATVNPELARAILFGVVNAIEESLESALRDQKFIGTSVVVSVDPAILGNPNSAKVRDFLVALGYTVSVSVPAGTVTISW
jgi:hypothetical protein